MCVCVCGGGGGGFSKFLCELVPKSVPLAKKEKKKRRKIYEKERKVSYVWVGVEDREKPGKS